MCRRKISGAVLGEVACWDEVEVFLVREIRNLDILSMKKSTVLRPYNSCRPT